MTVGARVWPLNASKFPGGAGNSAAMVCIFYAFSQFWGVVQTAILPFLRLVCHVGIGHGPATGAVAGPHAGRCAAGPGLPARHHAGAPLGARASSCATRPSSTLAPWPWRRTSIAQPFFRCFLTPRLGHGAADFGGVLCLTCVCPTGIVDRLANGPGSELSGFRRSYSLRRKSAREGGIPQLRLKRAAASASQQCSQLHLAALGGMALKDGWGVFHFFPGKMQFPKW